MWNHNVARHIDLVEGHEHLTGEIYHPDEEDIDNDQDETQVEEPGHQLELEMSGLRLKQSLLRRSKMCFQCRDLTKNRAKHAKRRCNGKNPCNTCTV